MASNSSWKKSSTNAKQIQKNWSTYKANKTYKKQMKAAEKKQPTYTNAYKGYEDAVVSNLENREFKYDANNPIYQAYSNDYRLLGNIGADQSQANIESLSGGYGTTYSGDVASQQLQGYLQNEKAILPSLQQIERQNYQQDTANLINKGNLYNQLESQDFAQFQDKLAKWNANREYAYNKFYNDYMASARQHEVTKGTEKLRETEGGTSTRELTGGSGGRSSSKYSRMNKDTLKSRKGAMAYLASNGLDASNVMSKEQFAAENASRGWNTYMKGREDLDKKTLNKDYEDYLLNYIRQAQGYDDTDWFSKKQKKLGYANKKH